MACLSILPIIIIIVLLINIFNNNDENLNIFLIVLICFFIVFQFIKKDDKKENVDNVEINQENETEEETQKPEKKNEIKYLNVDKDFINNLVNKDHMIIDNLEVKTIDLNFVGNLLYPVGVIVFSWLSLDKLNLPGKWKALPGSRLITTTGNLKYSFTKGQTEKEIKFNDNYSNTYTEYNCDFENINEDINKHKYLSSLDKTQDNVKLCANNVMNHKHIVYVNYGRVSRAKDGSQHAFALYGNGDDNQIDRCNDNSVKRIQSSYEVFPSRRTVYYDGDNQEKTITLDSVKAHTNIPRYILLYAYERIE